jgi:hypothetical protein
MLIALVAGSIMLAKPPVSTAQVTISADTQASKLSIARTNLQKQPDDTGLQQAYIDSFPQTYSEFLRLFDYRAPLADGHEYMETLRSLISKHELAVGRLLVRLSKDAHYEADAPSYLQQTTAAYGSEHIVTFTTLLEQLLPKERASLIVFLADVENHASYYDYDNIVRQLKTHHQTELAKQFESAREQRKARHYH